jgi:hypothetical protein
MLLLMCPAGNFYRRRLRSRDGEFRVFPLPRLCSHIVTQKDKKKKRKGTTDVLVAADLDNTSPAAPVEQPVPSNFETKKRKKSKHADAQSAPVDQIAVLPSESSNVSSSTPVAEAEAVPAMGDSKGQKQKKQKTTEALSLATDAGQTAATLSVDESFSKKKKRKHPEGDEVPGTARDVVRDSEGDDQKAKKKKAKKAKLAVV